MTLRQPRLLTAEGQERARLSPLRLTLDLTLHPLSTAEMVLPETGPAVVVRDFIELYDENGSVGIFRVMQVETTSDLTRTLYLEHTLNTLADGIVPPTSFTGSTSEALSLLLACQPEVHWQPGVIDLPGDTTLLFTCGCINLLTALTQLLELLPDTLALTFDQRVHPWTLNLAALSDKDACEGRLSRSLTSLRIETDAADLCTRVYPFGAGQGTERISLAPLTGQDWLDSSAMGTWGCIARTFTAGNIFDAPTLQAVAEKYLARHSSPVVSITADAIDLSAITGEAADTFRLGQLCRLVLPQPGGVMHERIIGIHRPDLISQPRRMTLTLSNRLKDASDEIADLLREVTASRILGGRVTDAVTTNRAAGTATSPVEHYFRVEDWAAVLACTVLFDADDGVRVTAVQVDGNPVPEVVYADGQFDALAYLRRDSLGVITQGRHTLAFFPATGAVNSTVKMKVIEKI